MSEIIQFGTKNIPLPNTAVALDFHDGTRLADEYVAPFIRDFSAGRIQFFLLIPAKLPPRLDKCGRSSIGSDFFIGLLEPLLRETRDTHFPDMKAETNRSKIKEIGGTDGTTKDPADTLTDIVMATWKNSDPLEQFLNDRINLCLIHDDGSLTKAIIDQNRKILSPASLSPSEILHHCCYKYFKALDAMFFSNLTASQMVRTIEQEKAQSGQPFLKQE